MIIATTITYNDWPLIKDCIESVIDKVDKIVVIDGKFKDFPGKSDFSTDHTHSYLNQISQLKEDKFVIVKVRDFDEVEKRNIYFKFFNDGDICLNIDTDEVLIGDIPQLTADIGIVMIGEQGDTKRHRRTIRFFRYQKGLHYWGTHKMILDKDGRLFANLDHIGKGYTAEKITEFELLHNNHKRDYNRVKDKKAYYQTLMKREAKINEPVT